MEDLSHQEATIRQYTQGMFYSQAEINCSIDLYMYVSKLVLCIGMFIKLFTSEFTDYN